MTDSSSNSVFKGALMTVLMRWTDRLIGFISTLILARVLVPEDFGVIAMASLVVGLLDVLLDLGVNVALIQNRTPSQAHYDSAWTLRLAQAGTTALLIVIASPFAGDYFNDPRVTPVLQFMALSLFVAGLENIGTITFQKEMRFDLEYRFNFSKRIVAFLVTVTSAWLLHSYWALVFGTLAGRIFGVFLSYRMVAMRPRLCTEKMREIFAVSQWMLVNSIGIYLNANLHKMFVGRFASTGTMGGYTLADEISAMPSTEILAPLNRVLFPAFVRAKHDLAELKRVFLLAQGVQCLIAVPASLGLAFIAHDAVLVLLGERWSLAIPFVQVLALSNVVQAITNSGAYMLLTLGKVRSVTLTTWAQVLLVAFGTLVVLHQPEALDIAILRVSAVFAGLVLAMWILMHNMAGLRLLELLRTVVRPILATALMGGAIYGLGLLTTDLPVVVAMFLKIFAGMLSYAAAVVLIWRLAGRPDGAESYVFDKLAGALRRRKAGTA